MNVRFSESSEYHFAYLEWLSRCTDSKTYFEFTGVNWRKKTLTNKELETWLLFTWRCEIIEGGSWTTWVSPRHPVKWAPKQEKPSNCENGPINVLLSFLKYTFYARFHKRSLHLSCVVPNLRESAQTSAQVGSCIKPNRYIVRLIHR